MLSCRKSPPIRARGWLVVLCLLFTFGCSRPDIPDYGAPDRFGEDPLVGRLIAQRLEELRRDPGQREAWIRLGMAFEANDFLPEALVTYRAATRLGEDARLLYRLANTHVASGQVAEAVPLFLRATELAPGYAPLYWRLGLVHLRLGQLDEAARYFHRALELAPNLIAAQIGLARVALQQGDPAAAVDHLEQALRVAPGLATGHHLLGIAYRQLGQPEKARAHLRAGIPGAQTPNPSTGLAAPPGSDPWQEELSGSRVSHRMLIEVAGQAFAAGDYAKARSTLETLREHRPDDITLILNLATVYRRVGQRAAAIDLLHAALVRHPSQVRLALDLGSTHLENGDAESALATARQARSIAPNAPEPLALEARALLASGQPATAEPLLRQALTLAPADPDLHLDLAAALTSLGREEEAVEHEAKSRSLGANPDSTESPEISDP